jgi:thiol peroxidase
MAGGGNPSSQEYIARIVKMDKIVKVLIMTTAVLAGCQGSTKMERANLITFKGSPLTLVGKAVNVGQKAPDVTLTDTSMSPVKISSYAGKVVVLSCVPSLDTGVCDTQTRKFNEKAAGLSKEVEILTISMDLPFGQKRWCGAAGVDRVKTLSDYKGATFAEAYGLLIKEWHLIARAVIVLDKQQVVRYIQIVPEISTEPDYDAVLKAVKSLL